METRPDVRTVPDVSREQIATQQLGHSLAAMERERAAWVREVHDETLQRLSAVRLTLAAARRASHEDMRLTLEQAIEVLGGEIADLRSRLMRLRPIALDELGLPQALESLALSHADGGIDVRLYCSIDHGPAHRLDRELESALFRVAQEALANATEHGRPDTVEVRISKRAGVISLSVVDDGVGFDPEAETDGHGLHGIEERIALLEGELAVNSAPGRGTSIEAQVPVAA